MISLLIIDWLQIFYKKKSIYGIQVAGNLVTRTRFSIQIVHFFF